MTCFTRLTATLALAGLILAQPPAHAPVAAQTQKWSTKTSSAKTSSAKTASEDASPRSKGEQGIVLLVNDDPITAYQIEQRARLLALNVNVSEQAKENFQRLVKAESTNARFRALQEEVLRENQGKSREQIIAIFQERQKQFAATLQKQAIDSARAGVLPRVKNQAKEELIEERLKVQEAKKLGIEVTDDDVKRMLQTVAERNKMTYDQFAQHLKGMGVAVSTMGERFRAQRAWRDLIARRYGAQVSVTQFDVDRVLSSGGSEAGSETVELQIGKIVLGLPAKIDQQALAKRFADAESLRRKFSGCKSLGQLVNGVSGAKLEDLRFVKPGAIPEPMRSMLLSAKDGDMLPPATTGAGVEIYALCGRRAAAADEAKRSKAKEDLQYKQLETLAQRHMRNLRQDAHIEYR
jgi:peptidyl-prolyl cis-trans isomerase SurA